MVSHSATSTAPSPKVAIPRLEPGDRLTRDEFERRYQAMPELKRAELIEGVVHMPPATRWDNHAKPHADLIGPFIFYRAGTRGVTVGNAGSIRLDLINEPQPDIAMMIDPEFGGRAALSKDDYVEGSPELVAEISASSVSIDLNAKLPVYRRNGVQEYLVWRVYDGEIDWFSLKNGAYQLLPSHPDGTIRSEVFPGLWIDVPSLIAGDLATVLRKLQQGLESPEHQAFVSALQSRQSAPPRPEA